VVTLSDLPAGTYLAPWKCWRVPLDFPAFRMSADPIDLDVLRSFIGDDAGDLSASLALFVESATKAREELRTAEAAGDAEMAGATAHRFKSVARYLGAAALAAACERIERAGRRGDLEAIRRERPSLEAELTRVLDALAAMPILRGGPPK
jgi:HPt (histidine-containing phosphotransfer) domain-containing protein